MSLPPELVVLAEQEAKALAAFLTADGRRVMVFVAATDGVNVVLTRGAGGDTTTRDARAFVKVLAAESARIADLIPDTEAR